jgi:hypothetical protein
MPKIVGGKFKLSWTPSISTDVVSYVIYFSADGIIDYDTPDFIELTGVATAEFNFPSDAGGFLPPSANEKTFAAIAAKDDVGNLSDLSVVVEIPFDVVAPDGPTNFQLG